MVEVVDYKPEHLEKIALKSCHEGERPNEIRGNALTLLGRGVPLAIFGWYFICPGVVQVWGLVSDEAAKAKKSFHNTVKLLISFAFERHPILRMQISVRTSYQTGWKWAKSLGFECEGVMKKYGPGGTDCWLFAKVNHVGR